MSALFHSNVFYLLFFNSKNTLPIMLPYPYIIKTFRGIIGIQKPEYLMDLIWWIWKYSNTQNIVIYNSSIFTLQVRHIMQNLMLEWKGEVVQSIYLKRIIGLTLEKKKTLVPDLQKSRQRIWNISCLGQGMIDINFKSLHSELSILLSETLTHPTLLSLRIQRWFMVVF